MPAKDIDATGFIDAPMELVRELVQSYVDTGCDTKAMRQIVLFVMSMLTERALVARLTRASSVNIGDCELTMDEARDRIEGLQALPVF